jgi:hypothetical protein
MASPKHEEKTGKEKHPYFTKGSRTQNHHLVQKQHLIRYAAAVPALTREPLSETE